MSSLAFFIGKDYEIPVKLNKPGEGWHWDFKDNIIRIDPIDLLEKPIDYLRFVISHEGGTQKNFTNRVYSTRDMETARFFLYDEFY